MTDTDRLNRMVEALTKYNKWEMTRRELHELLFVEAYKVWKARQKEANAGSYHWPSYCKPCPRCGTGSAMFSTQKQRVCDSCAEIETRVGQGR